MAELRHDHKAKVETRSVLAACYLGPNKGRYTGHRMLTHAVELDAEGMPVRVLCNRVMLDSIADANAGDRHAPPTCAHCRRRWDRYQ